MAATCRTSTTLGPLLRLTGAHESPLSGGELGALPTLYEDWAEAHQESSGGFKLHHIYFWAGPLGKGPLKSQPARTAHPTVRLPSVYPPDLGHTPPCADGRAVWEPQV